MPVLHIRLTSSHNIWHTINMHCISFMHSFWLPTGHVSFHKIIYLPPAKNMPHIWNHW